MMRKGSGLGEKRQGNVGATHLLGLYDTCFPSLFQRDCGDSPDPRDWESVFRAEAMDRRRNEAGGGKEELETDAPSFRESMLRGGY